MFTTFGLCYAATAPLLYLCCAAAALLLCPCCTIVAPLLQCEIVKGKNFKVIQD
ncbi:hypothetical protein SLEP1_g22788 [Rubroshorea leprosula]|uniref:Uncharacterized protein n=1 Tax=Rubroshorea leprosula TaxID=152421 RepID=A0AAV5JAC3_9ROSI|nr:hypothetical protein SLEP1_g22788 [Rubroshorea leprosula]